MENNQTDPNKAVTPANQTPNDDASRKQPEQNGSADNKAEIDPEVPNFDIKKKGNPDDVRMNRDAGKENEGSDTTEDMEEKDSYDEGNRTDPDSQEKERTNKVTL